jgi:hypothetical protein
MSDFDLTEVDINLFRAPENTADRAWINIRPGWFQFEVTKVVKNDEAGRFRLTCTPLDADGARGNVTATLFMSLPHPAVCAADKIRMTGDAWYTYLMATRPSTMLPRAVYDKATKTYTSPDGAECLAWGDAEAIREKTYGPVLKEVNALWADPDSILGDNFYARVEHTTKDDKTYANVKGFSVRAQTDETIIRESFAA